MGIFINEDELSSSQDVEKNRTFFDKLYDDNNLVSIAEKIDFLQDLKKDMLLKNKENISRIKRSKEYTRIEDEIIHLEEQLRHNY